jgi:hypothetical protein
MIAIAVDRNDDRGIDVLLVVLAGAVRDPITGRVLLLLLLWWW